MRFGLPMGYKDFKDSILYFFRTLDFLNARPAPFTKGFFFLLFVAGLAYSAFFELLSPMTSLFLMGTGVLCFAWLQTELFFLFIFIFIPIQRQGALTLNLHLVKIALLCLVLVILQLRGKTSLRNDSGGVAFVYGMWVLYAILNFCFSWFSAYPDLSFEYYEIFLVTSLLFPVFLRILSFESIDRIHFFFILNGLLVSGIGMFQFLAVHYNLYTGFLEFLLPIELKSFNRVFIGEDPTSITLRIPSVFTHPNQFGYFLSLIFPLALYGYQKALTWRKKAFYFLTLASFIFCIILSQSRVAIACIAFSGIFILYYERKISLRMILTACFLLLVSLGALYLVFPNILLNSWARFMESGLSHRNILWEIAAQIIPEHWWSGSGMGMSGYEIFSHSGPLNEELFYLMIMLFNLLGKVQFVFITPHNFYLKEMIEGGLVSVLLFAGIFSFIFLKGLKIFRDSRGTIFSLALISVSVMITEIFRSMVEGYIVVNYGDMIIVYYMALIFFLDNASKKSEA